MLHTKGCKHAQPWTLVNTISLFNKRKDYIRNYFETKTLNQTSSGIGCDYVSWSRLKLARLAIGGLIVPD